MKRILLIFLMIAAAASVPFAAANADTETNAAARPFLPATYEEYCELEELMDVYYDEGMTILSENDKVWVSRGNGYTAYEAPQKNVKMARRFQNDVLVQDSLVLYRLSLSDGTFTQVEDTNGSPITAGNFSLNDRYLAVTTNTDIRVYRITEAGFTPVRTVTTGAGRDNIPVYVTDANFLYYHINADNLIYWKDLDANEGGELQLRTSEEIKALHVRDGVVYYIMNTSVLSFDLSQKITDTVLTAEGTQKIGTVHSPISLAFRGENLLVADSGINAVQEFAPAGDGNWRYTGFAITGSGRGENRISGAADAAYAGGTVYILDGNGEILAVGAGGAQTDYRRIAPGEKLTFSPVKIETDGKTILLADAVQAAFYNPETGELTPAAAVRSPLYDIAYANGMYYILSGDRVIAYDAETLSPVSLITSLAVGENSLIAADVDRNLYLYDSGTETVVRYGEDGPPTARSYQLPEAAISIGADLNGNLFALCADNRVYSFREETASAVITTDLPAANARAMCMAFDSATVWFVYDGAGYMTACDSLGNDNIQSVAAPALTLTEASRADGALALRTVTEGKNLYEMNYSAEASFFAYVSLARADGTTEFLSVAETDGFEVLLFQDQLYLAKKAHVSPVGRQTTETEGTKAYLITSAYFYYYPIVEPAYQLSGMAKLPVQTEIRLYGEITLNGRDYCYAGYADGGTEIRGFLPKSFVTEHYSGIYDGETFTDGTSLPGSEHALRNAIVFILVGLSVGTTSVYFVLRKKRRKD